MQVQSPIDAFGADASTKLTPVNWDTLSGVRFALAIIVCQYHGAIFYDFHGISQIVASFGGKAAVIGFLIISGFSIRSSLDQGREGFLARRMVRIFPVYITTFLFVCALQTIVNPYSTPFHSFKPDTSFVLLCNGMLLQMFACKALDYNVVVWSLSIEFSFYICAFFAHKINEKVLICSIILSVALFCWPIDHDASSLFHVFQKFKPTKFLWPFVIGYMLYSRNNVLFVSSSAALTVSAICISPEVDANETFAFVTILATYGLIYFSKTQFRFRSPNLRFLGDISYPLYLTHLPVYMSMDYLMHTTNPVALTLAALISSIIVFSFIEKPARQNLRKALNSRYLDAFRKSACID